MKINEDEAHIRVAIGSGGQMTTQIEPKRKIDVLIGDAAKMDCQRAINYIKSGTAEIDKAVEEGIEDFNANAVAKTNAFNTNATNKTNAFDLNASNKTQDFNDNATSKTGDFNSNATDKTNTFNQNATDKTGDFNDNATDKTNDFNSNASNKTQDFNDNYVAKKQIIDDAVSDAQGYATSASNSADLAKQWAIGDPSEPVGYSSKYWANEASSTVSNMANKDLSNLSATGDAKFVQPSQLATVATTGDYDDLINKPIIPAAQVNSDWNAVSGVAQILNKPTIPTVNNSTITITQGGVTKGSFTLNQASGDTIALDAGGGGGSYTAGTGIDITSNVISVTSPTLINKSTKNSSYILTNYSSGLTTTVTNAVSIGYGSEAKSNMAVVIGESASVAANVSGSGMTSVGCRSFVNGAGSVALGYMATVNNAAYAIQLGYGTNSEANSFYVATSSLNNWKLLGNDGLIPDARISNNFAKTDASNFTATGKSTIAEYAMPSDSYVALTPVAHEALLVTAPANGYVTIMGTTISSISAVGFIVCESTSTSASDKQKMNQIVWCNAGASNGLATYVPVKKGDKVYQIAVAFSTVFVRFIYAEGEI